LPVATYTTLAKSADQLLEIILGNTTFTIASQNLVKGIQVAGSRVTGLIQAGDAPIIVNGTKFAITIKKVSKATYDVNGISLNVTSV
jgi:hypothetical protein